MAELEDLQDTPITVPTYTKPIFNSEKKLQLERPKHTIGGTSDFGGWISDAQWSNACRRA
jgi:hypothetical protein